MSERIICNETGGELREEIVRCRDCAYFASDEIGGYCTLMDFEDVRDMADRFCSWGVRREEPMSDELLPCPFCGGKAHTFHNYLWHVRCDGTNGRYYCVMAFGAFATEAEAIAAWNRRAK